MVRKGILGTKLGMTQVFTDDNEVVPVTVLRAGPCPVTQVRTKERDGYRALQLGYGRAVEGRGHDEQAQVLAHEHARRLEQGDVVGEERPLVADHFQLHPVREADLASEPGRADGLVRSVTAGRVRKNEDAALIDVVDQRLFRFVGEVHPPHGDRHHVRARRAVRIGHDRGRRIFACADDQSGCERPAGDDQGI